MVCPTARNQAGLETKGKQVATVAKEFSTIRSGNGEFQVCWNGEPTEFSIINGSHGHGGKGAVNVYGIQHNAKVTWVGSLQAAKAMCSYWLQVKHTPSKSLAAA